MQPLKAVLSQYPIGGYGNYGQHRPGPGSIVTIIEFFEHRASPNDLYTTTMVRFYDDWGQFWSCGLYDIKAVIL